MAESDLRARAATADELLPVLYQELRRLAETYLDREPRGHTLQPTALVHEAYLRVAGLTSIDWRDPTHFFGAAAGAMRRVLVDHARRKAAARRGDPRRRVTLDEEGVAASDGVDVVELDDALRRLASLNPRHARIVELRFFAGLSVPEVAKVLGVSASTVAMDWRIARAWLNGHLAADA